MTSAVGSPHERRSILIMASSRAHAVSNSYLFTSESVAEGHPDKVADQISDSILDAILAVDKNARVDCETLVMESMVIVTGQITTRAVVNYKRVIRGVLRGAGP